MRISELKKHVVHVSPDDRALLELAAEHEGVTLSAFVVGAAKAKAETVLEMPHRPLMPKGSSQS